MKVKVAALANDQNCAHINYYGSYRLLPQAQQASQRVREEWSRGRHVLVMIGFQRTEEEQQELDEQIREERKVQRDYLSAHPFPTYSDLKREVQRSGNPFDEEVHALLQRIYDDSYGHDRDVNRDVGEQLNQRGGFDLMTAAYYALQWHTPVKDSDELLVTHAFNCLRYDWNGIGTWMA